MPEVPAGEDVRVTLIVRFLPGPPYFIQTFVLGMARVPFRIYLPLSIVGSAGTALGFLFLGEALIRGGVGLIFFAVSFLIAVFLILQLVRRRLGPAGPRGNPDSTAAEAP
ncbi:MAG: hypothetical protein EA425_00805 [Puniceicoccaceae bacterium]|nr:MAG: hypothetical protein EA425_00805 [Puniceicoccaceae bacterium]